MILKELIESGLVKDEDNLMIHVPIFGNVRQIRCGKWFNDQILDLMDRAIDRVVYQGGEWEIDLQFPEE